MPSPAELTSAALHGLTSGLVSRWKTVALAGFAVGMTLLMVRRASKRAAR